LGKGVRGWMQCNKMYTQASKCKNDTCWNYSWNLGRGRWRRMDEGVNSWMIYLIHCNCLCQCHNIPPPIRTAKGKNRSQDTSYVMFCTQWEYSESYYICYSMWFQWAWIRDVSHW
jgi:hypothetical protein